MIIRNTIICIITMLMSLIAYGAEEEKANDALCTEVPLSHTGSRNKDVQRSLTNAMLYVEKPVSADYSVFGNTYADKEFKSILFQYESG